MNEEIKKIYEQDCQFVRHHHSTMWNRFQTAAAIEAAMLFGLYQVHSLGLWERRLFSLGGCILVAMACVLTFTDRMAARSHLARIKVFEKEANFVFELQNPKLLSTPIFLIMILLLLTVCNILLVIRSFSH